MEKRSRFTIEYSDICLPVGNFHLTVCGKIKHFFRRSWLTWMFKRRLPAELEMTKILIEHSEINWTF